MRSSPPRAILDALGSLRLTLVLLVLFGVAIAVATFLENRFGSAGSRALVYGARWFEALLALITLNLLVTLRRWIPFRPRQLGFVLVHVSMIVILAGAGMTRYFGQEGSVHIREGGRSDTMLSREPHIQVTVDGELRSFPVNLYRAGQSMSRSLSFADGKHRVSVTDYWPRYEPDLARTDLGGGALQLTVNTGEDSALNLQKGGQRVVNGVRLGYQDGTLLSSLGDAPLGTLVVSVGEARATLPVMADGPPTSTEVAGFVATITEFQADFSVGGTSEGPRRMTNPMIRVRIVGPDGSSEERMLFAYFPEFARQHGQTQDALTAVQTDYRFERRILFAGDGDSLVARSSFPLLELRMDDASGEQTVLPPGREFVVKPLTVYRTARNDFSVVWRGGDGSGTTRMADGEVSAAARIVVESPSGDSVSAVVMRGTRSKPLGLGNREVVMAFGPIPIELPYELGLDDFQLLTYPGSDRPSGYVSHVRLYDFERNIDGRPAVIRMNGPLTHRGYKHFQNSYDSDNRGTILSVNQDPGKWPTYVGYVLITLGFLLALLKNVIWP